MQSVIETPFDRLREIVHKNVPSASEEDILDLESDLRDALGNGFGVSELCIVFPGPPVATGRRRPFVAPSKYFVPKSDQGGDG